MASTSASRRTASTPPVPTVFPDEIWEEIFLRLDAAADLARASAACSSFRRIVSARQFLRRFRSLHSPPVLGFITSDGRPRFLPVEPPHRSAPEARVLEQAADFTFSFLPDPCEWHVLHASDGRVLLGRRISTKTRFHDFLVCDPLHRRYVEIPRIPDDLMAPDNPMMRHVLPILTPACENDEEESFRVIFAVQDRGNGKVLVFVFSSCNQMWRGIISTICLPNRLIEYMSYYAHGCLYLMFVAKGYSLMLNTSEMEFSIIELPPHNFYSHRAIVEAEEGRLWFITIANGTSDLCCKNWQSNGVGAQELQHDKLIPVPNHSVINCDWEIDVIAGHYLALGAYPRNYNESLPNSEHFVLDMKTLVVEKLCTWNNYMFYSTVFPYARFPPPLAPPSI